MTVSYSDGNPVAVTAVVVSVQHAKDADPDALRRDVESPDHPQGNPRKLSHKGNAPAHQPSGASSRRSGGRYRTDRAASWRWTSTARCPHRRRRALRQGPHQDGPQRRVCGRWVAKNLVAAGLAKRCEVQIAYAIGESRPISVTVDAMGTGLVPDTALERAVKEVFDLRPGASSTRSPWRRPIYAPLRPTATSAGPN